MGCWSCRGQGSVALYAVLTTNLTWATRPIIHSEKINRKAWALILGFIRREEISGLVDSLGKFRQIEIQIFLNEALLHMPVDWLVAPARSSS